LKLIGVLKKHNLIKSFRKFKEENVDEMKIDLGNKINLSIVLDRRYNTTLTILKDLSDENLMQIRDRLSDLGLTQKVLKKSKRLKMNCLMS